ncbi:YpoC family protein [Bacillus kwashiorkori]|uniref:YpoC family protein n=1 Tax=Bacillus kwashiorkori TaxID=1522318 RepID=UPI000782AEAC|nr:hypothetical protein [Bacillus kwashiorkori]
MIAKEINHPLFYINNRTPKDFFMKENEYYLQKDNSVTDLWEDSNTVIDRILANWDLFKEEIVSLFSARKVTAIKEPMIDGIALFLKFLFLCNHQLVNFHSFELNIDKLDRKPVNLQERLSFVMNHPQQYHSFIQLSELFSEQRKIYSKYLAMEKLKQKGVPNTNGSNT